MAKLFSRMFCGDVPIRDAIFELRTSQIIDRSSRVAHQADWYSAAGVWLGCGDLSGDNIRRIARYLDPEDLFVVVDKQFDEYAMPRPIGWRKSPTYLGRECNIIVQLGHYYFIADYLAKHQRFYARAKCMFQVFDHRKARELIANANRHLAQEEQMARIQAS